MSADRTTFEDVAGVCIWGRGHGRKEGKKKIGKLEYEQRRSKAKKIERGLVGPSLDFSGMTSLCFLDQSAVALLGDAHFTTCKRSGSRARKGKN